jgi:hypothetical protein
MKFSGAHMKFFGGIMMVQLFYALKAEYSRATPKLFLWLLRGMG